LRDNFKFFNEFCATQNFITVFATTLSLLWYRSLKVDKLHPIYYLLGPV
jgi:hypothetical protein